MCHLSLRFILFSFLSSAFCPFLGLCILHILSLAEPLVNCSVARLPRLRGEHTKPSSDNRKNRGNDFEAIFSRDSPSVRQSVSQSVSQQDNRSVSKSVSHVDPPVSQSVSCDHSCYENIALLIDLAKVITFRNP